MRTATLRFPWTLLRKTVTWLRSSVVKKTLWITAQVIWIAVCVVSQIEAYKGYRGVSDWQAEEGLGFEMILLSFPASLVVAGGVRARGDDSWVLRFTTASL
jgi:hypothetical protein